VNQFLTVDLVSLTLIFISLAIIGGILVMPPEQIFAEEFIVEISDEISVGDTEPKTNFANTIIFKYNLISYL